MESRLTQSEMDAVLQLIQLSGNSGGDSGGDHDFHVFWMNIPAAGGGGGKRDIKLEEEEEREESVGETSWSNQEKLSEDDDDDEALPRRRRKIRSIVDIYRKTRPFIKNNRLYKRPKI
ncbi:hypothetical protein ABFX02_14G095300 [Erythranthe guttata]